MLPATRSTTNTGLIAFGSNQGDSMQVFEASIDALQRIAGIEVVAYSEPIWTTPVTGTSGSISTPSTEEQKPYLNAVIRIETRLNPSELHLQTAAIEHQFGRVRAGRWRARTIDLDLLLLGGHVVDTRSLTLPHPRMSFRRFVLEPAAEIAANVVHPTSQCSMAELLKRINSPVKTMALIASSSRVPAAALENFVHLLSKKKSQWKFEKVFSAEKLSQLDSNLTIVVTFDLHASDPQDTSWQKLKQSALQFAGPTLHLKNTSNFEATLNELVAALQTIG